LCAPGQAAQAAEPVWPQPRGYSVALSYDRASHSLSGRERITFANSGPRAVRSVWLRTWPNALGSCGRPWIRVRAERGARVAASAAGCTALRVRMPRVLAPGGVRTLYLRFRVRTPSAPNVLGRDETIDYFGNALPVLAVQDASGPHLNRYSVLGAVFYSLTAPWSVSLSLPATVSAATTGTVTSRRSVGGGRRRVHVYEPHSRDFALAIGAMRLERSSADGIRLNRWLLPSSSRSDARVSLSVAGAAVSAYSAWYGALDTREIDLVDGPSSLGGFGLGQEYPGIVFTPDDRLLVAHEIAHQWWYDAVGSDQWSAPWINESLAEYASRELPDDVVGSTAFGCDVEDPVRPFGSMALDSPMSDWVRAGATPYYRTVYLGGACALRSLEEELGGDRMRAFLASLQSAHRYGVIDAADFVAALRAAAPAGFDVDAWLRRARLVRAG
jgi:hypothetical protein